MNWKIIVGGHMDYLSYTQLGSLKEADTQKYD